MGVCNSNKDCEQERDGWNMDWHVAKPARSGMSPVTQVIGSYETVRHVERELLTMELAPTAITPRQRWHMIGMMADFMSEYLSKFLSGDDMQSLLKQVEIQETASHVMNELLENAMKFCYEAAQEPIVISMSLTAATARIYVKNSIDPCARKEYQSFIHTLMSEDPHALYGRLVTDGLVHASDWNNRLGLVSLLKEYNVTMGWKFEGFSGSLPSTVTTMVELSV